MDNPLVVDRSEPLLSTRTSATPTATEVVGAVARVMGTSPLELPPLYDSVDGEALERVLDSNPDSRVSFSYQGFRVVAEGDGTIAVYPGSASE